MDCLNFSEIRNNRRKSEKQNFIRYLFLTIINDRYTIFYINQATLLFVLIALFSRTLLSQHTYLRFLSIIIVKYLNKLIKITNIAHSLFIRFFLSSRLILKLNKIQNKNDWKIILHFYRDTDLMIYKLCNLTGYM